MTKKNSEKELLFSVTEKDLELQTFTSGGPGGQHQNRSQTGVRYIHHASGARGESREERSQWANKKRALKRLTEDPRFTWWVHEETQRLTGQKTAEERVVEMMHPDNLKIEVRDAEGKWVSAVDGQV